MTGYTSKIECTNSGDNTTCTFHPAKGGVKRGEIAVVVCVIVIMGVIVCCILYGCFRGMNTKRNEVIVSAGHASTDTAQDIEEVSSVQQFDNLLNSSTKDGKGVFAMVFAPWCGHCKSTKPELPTVQELLGNDVSVVTVNGDLVPEVLQRYNITGYPYFLRITSDGEVQTQPQPRQRSAEELAIWFTN